jgi:hypothetical protein
MAMSFLDNLENNLKAMESRTERDPEALAGEAAAREAARSAALEIAPHAEALRNGPFKDAPLTACRTSVTASERFCWLQPCSADAIRDCFYDWNTLPRLDYKSRVKLFRDPCNPNPRR